MRAKDGQFCVRCERHHSKGSEQGYGVVHYCWVKELDKTDQVTGTTVFTKKLCDNIRNTKRCVWTPMTRENM